MAARKLCGASNYSMELPPYVSSRRKRIPVFGFDNRVLASMKQAEVGPANLQTQVFDRSGRCSGLEL
jgi:hypothetical protein